MVDDSDLGGFVAVLKEAQTWADAEVEMLAVSSVLEKEANAFEAEYLELVRPTFQPSTAADMLVTKAALNETTTTTTQKYEGTNLLGEPTTVERKSGPPSDQGGGFTNTMLGGVSSVTQSPIKKLFETGVERAFTQPYADESKKLSDRMKNVQRQIILQDLIVNDPVLADEPPENVANAYNTLLQMAPEVSMNKEVVRAILRQSVHSVAVSPYDAEMWTKLEQNIRGIKGKGVVPSQGQGAGAKGGGR